MRVSSLSALLVILILVLCKGNAHVKNDFGEASLPAALDVSAEENTVTGFVDEYAQYEYFDINRYIADEGGVWVDSIAYINKTCFVQVFRVEAKDFEDEDSEAYYTAMDDLAYYMYNTRERMTSLNVESVTSKQRFLSFEVEGGSPIIIDTDKHRGGTLALLYKKGRKPLAIDIVSDSIDLEFGKIDIKASTKRLFLRILETFINSMAR